MGNEELNQGNCWSQETQGGRCEYHEIAVCEYHEIAGKMALVSFFLPFQKTTNKKKF